MRLWVRPNVRVNLLPRFSRAVNSAANNAERHRFASSSVPYLRINRDSRARKLLERKENSSRGYCQRFWARLCCHIDARKPRSSIHHQVLLLRFDALRPHFGSGMLTGFPFDKTNHGAAQGAFSTELSYLLGSTDPCPSTVHMEPFSTSVFKVLIWIFATNTKICTRGRSTQAHAKGFATRTPRRSAARLRPPRPATHLCFAFAQMAEYRWLAGAPSIFRASSFGRWVVTHSLADFDFHDHRPAVKMN